MRSRLKIPGVAIAALLFGCMSGGDNPDPVDDTPRAGGALTVFDGSSAAFSMPAPNLSAEELSRHAEGDAAFEASFVTAPAAVNPGLGPLFNNTSCAACHAGDGRGRPPEPGEQLTSMLFRINASGTDEHGGPKAMPGYGGQLQTRAIFGHPPEATVSISYRDSTVTLSGGATVTLRVPQYALQNHWKPLSETPLLSPRVAPPVFGLGLLEAVSETDVLSRADATDQNSDGISGKPNYVYDARRGTKVLGRFGWKANNPNLDQQNAGAYNQDMGVTNPIFNSENCAGDRETCISNGLEVDNATLADVTFYIRSLGVPSRRDLQSASVLQGEQLFASVGCTACHAPEMRTGNGPGSQGLEGQTFHPYTDLLLHNMGEGLSDGRPDFDAAGNEWRTSPLWGIGLTRVVNGHTFFLHDGRARNLMEAILWHGGEAEKSRNAVRQLTPDERQSLITFLESL